MRDSRLITEHRGGELATAHHHLLMNWSLVCVEHVIHLADEKYLPLIEHILSASTLWMLGKATVGDARKASMKAVEAARSIEDPVSCLVVRAVGHMAATAHMADHCLRASSYALKAVKESGGDETEEIAWQEMHIPDAVKSLILSTWDH